MSSKNSVTPDPMPFQPPKADEAPKKISKSDWARLAKSKKYKEIQQYFETRKEYARHFLPDGTPIKDTKPTPENWAAASWLIDEISNIQMMIHNHAEREKK